MDSVTSLRLAAAVLAMAPILTTMDSFCQIDQLTPGRTYRVYAGADIVSTFTSDGTSRCFGQDPMRPKQWAVQDVTPAANPRGGRPPAPNQPNQPQAKQP